tara:strand:+ start:2568 stop:4190 length:1623 start_codon:yes stop_codon:yes gene_type:complete
MLDYDTMEKTFFERNSYLIDHEVNVLFEELLEMNDDQFEQWVRDMRTAVVSIWDEHGCPPRTGKNEDGIIHEWNRMAEYPIHKFTHTDELSDIEDDVIINKVRIGAEADQWFPNMMKTRINYSEKDDGYSIYDLFARDDLFDKMLRGCKRHFKRDSLYAHALSCFKNNKKPALISVDDAETWVYKYHKYKGKIFKGYDFILEQVKQKDGNNTGYNTVEQSNILQLTKDQVLDLKEYGLLEFRHHSTFDIEDMPDDRVYSIRIYKKGGRVFPKGYPAFRIGYIQVAHNFPPMTAKYLYEKFSDHIKDQEVINIYDPSAGWGGRMLGAMSVRDDRRIHYIGTDPNPDNYYDIPSGTRSKYGDIADFYNTKTYRGNSFFSETNTYDVYQLGSEEIQHDPYFQEYKGKLDLIFTSPPYFNREAYSEDENQSYKKYGDSYESWREGFLRPTLETCVEWLRPDRYLLWNIADLLVKGEYLPLEKDSRDILEACGMTYKYTMKMAMEGMPGQNRVGEDGKPKCKNFCLVNGKYMKYEPVFVFYKGVE